VTYSSAPASGVVSNVPLLSNGLDPAVALPGPKMGAVFANTLICAAVTFFVVPDSLTGNSCVAIAPPAAVNACSTFMSALSGTGFG